MSVGYIVLDRRRNFRIPVRGEALFVIGSLTLASDVIDISNEGLAVRKPADFRLVQGRHYEVELTCLPYFSALSLRGFVTHCSLDRVGLKCVSMSDQARKIFRGGISEMLVNEALVYDRAATLCFV
jgi:hypothetical protein